MKTKKAMGAALASNTTPVVNVSENSSFSSAKTQAMKTARSKARTIHANSPKAGFGKGMSKEDIANAKEAGKPKAKARDLNRRGWNANRATTSDADIRHNSVGRYGRSNSNETTVARKQAIKDTFAGVKPKISTDNGRGMGVDYGDQLSVTGKKQGPKPLPKSFEDVAMKKSALESLEILAKSVSCRKTTKKAAGAAANPEFDMDAFDADNPVYEGDSHFTSLSDVDRRISGPKSKKAPSMDAAANKMKPEKPPSESVKSVTKKSLTEIGRLAKLQRLTKSKSFSVDEGESKLNFRNP